MNQFLSVPQKVKISPCSQSIKQLFQRSLVSAPLASSPPSHLSNYCESCADNLHIFCNVCHIGLNGLIQWKEHKIGRKHRLNLKKRKKPEPKPKVIFPDGTVIILEQTAIYYDAVQRYTSTLYERGLLRSRL